MSVEAEQAPAVSRTDPAVWSIINSIKAVVAEYGFCNVAQYHDCRILKREIPDEVLLPVLQEEGYGFVKSFVVDREVEQEVIVDLRLIAASMLLIYSGNYPRHNSVFKFVQRIHREATWDSAFVVANQTGLLGDIYANYGHHFTISEVAETADLTKETDAEIRKHAIRHSHPLRELVKNETELTAVYHLCLQVMHAVNNGHTKQDVVPVFRPGFAGSRAYLHFVRLGRKILDKHYESLKKAR